ncbi:MAG: hypothetical protein WAT91_08715, partial [Saprospiraceae bacterium]
MMKITLRISSLLFVLFSWSATAVAQTPANDNCSNALDVVFSTSEGTAVLTNGDSRGATASANPASVCSSTFYTDDTWYKFTTPAVNPDAAVIIHVYFGDGPSTDVTAVGMAVYESCGTNETSLVCVNSYDPTDNKIELSGECMIPNHTYYVRVWSIGADATTEGTFRVGVYPVPYAPDNVLWIDKFDSNPFSRGWTTYGDCVLVPDSSANAVWDFLPNGGIQASAFTAATIIGAGSYCDGAVGVNSDFNDNGGTGVSATGSVPTSTNATGSTSVQAVYALQSPAIYMGDWNVSGITVVFNQVVRELRSDFTLSYRNKNAGDPNWSTWTDFPINQALVANASNTINRIRQFLPGANNADSIQLKLTYLAHYYFWIVDDFQIVETECNNTRVGGKVGDPPFYAIAPWAVVPNNQVYPFPVLSDIYNAGSCTQTNVNLNSTVTDSLGNVLYNENLSYGSIEADSTAQNKLFPDLVNVPAEKASYEGTYTLSQDSQDYDASDNSASYHFRVGGNAFALEDGATRSLAPAASNYTAGSPMSYVYGNYFQPVVDAEATSIEWGVNNPTAMEGLTVNVLLLQWTDTNGDEKSAASERRYISAIPYTFTGLEGDPAMITTPLENFDNPGDPVIMKAGFGYMAVIEYQAVDATSPVLFLQASEARDYSATNLAFDSAYTAGLTDRKFYASVLGLAADGNVAEIDYGVTAAGTFGFDIVPIVRINVDLGTNTVDQLPLADLVSIYPNPVSDEVQVKMEFKKPYHDVQLRLINILGQTVFRKSISSTGTSHV